MTKLGVKIWRVFALALGLVCASIPVSSWADERLQVADGGEVPCTLSLHGITRISAVGDAFVTDIKRSAGDGNAEFSVANEGMRGDIYVSLPDGYSGRGVSFFAITRKGFVYKLQCSVMDMPSQQIFIENPQAQEGAASVNGSAWEQPLLLVKAMGEGRPLPGYSASTGPAQPVFVGPAQVQIVSVYTGTTYVGKRIEITNVGRSTITLTKEEIAPPGHVVFSMSQWTLKPREKATAYVVIRKQN
jgi:conjugal transfer pilus assembly protein TraK